MIFDVVVQTRDHDICISVPFGCSHESVFTTRYHWSNHSRKPDTFVIVQWTLSGYGVFEYDNQRWNVPEETAFIAIAPEPSSYYFSAEAAEPWTFSWINLYGSWAVDLCRNFRRQFGVAIPLRRTWEAADEFARLAVSAERRDASDRFERSADCYGFLMKWARELNRPGDPSIDPIAGAVHFCSTHFHEPVGVKHLAAQAGMSREHFTRRFKEHTGVSPAHFLREIRTRKARGILRTGRVSLREAALRCGFSSARALRRAL